MRVWRQTDSPWRTLRAHGCGAYAAVNAYGWASDGEVAPDTIIAAGAAAQVRVNASGVSDADFARRGLTSRELERSLLAIKARPERPDLDVQRRSGVHVRSVLIPQMLDEDAGALVAVDYGVIQDAGKGVGTYRKGHWVFASDPRSDDIAIADSLRNKVVRWPIPLLVRAAERFGDKPWGNGRAEAIVVWRWPTYRDLMVKARKQRDEARSQRDTAKARVAELEALADGTALTSLVNACKTAAADIEAVAERLDKAVEAADTEGRRP